MKTLLVKNARARLLGVSTFCMLGVVVPLHANAFTVVGVYSDTSGETYCIEVPPGQLVDLYVVIAHVPGTSPQTVSSIQFGDYLASWGGSGVYHANTIPMFPFTLLPGQLRLDFGACLSPPVHVLTIRVVGGYPPECRRLWVDEVIVRDCANQPIDVVAGSGWATAIDTICGLIPPSNQYPPDGATLVPRNVVLTWGDMVGQSSCSGPDQYGVSFGTSPNPSGAWMGWDQFYDPPGTLRENTTYYWRVSGFRPSVGEISGPLLSFTTGPGTVPVKRSTWGGIKALYR
jgi:hypothetical protein